MTAPAERVGAVAYLRTSTSRQDLSPEAQLHAIEQWAAARGVPILAVHADLDTSSQAPVGERPHLALAIDDVRRRRAAYLVAARSDRLHRRASVADEIRNLTALAGGRVVTADGVEDGDTDSPSAWLISKILDVVAEYEVIVLRARTRAAIDVRRRKGLVIGDVPLGYTTEQIGKTSQGKPICRLVVDPGEAAASQLAASLRADGRGYAAIGRQLVECGYLPRGKAARKRGAWHPESVRRLIDRAPDLLGDL